MTRNLTTPVLIGRVRQMEILNRGLYTAQNGTGRCILLAGEAGMGKSRLAAELYDRAFSANFWICQGYCSEQDRLFPYAPWMDALRAFLMSRNVVEGNELLGPFAPEMIKLLPELSLLLRSIQSLPPLDPAAEKHRQFETLAVHHISC
jgi:predicted ATPase